MAAPTGFLTLDGLRSAVADGHVDTVIVAFSDMQGRLVGKRVSAPRSSRRSPRTAPRRATTCSPSTST